MSQKTIIIKRRSPKYRPMAYMYGGAGDESGL